MKLRKSVSAWFDYPDDPDGARFHIRRLTPGERGRVQDAAFENSFEFEDDGQPRRRVKQSYLSGREMEVKLAVMEWENVFDDDDGGEYLKCIAKNKVRVLNEKEGFYEFYADCARRLDEMAKDREKN